jgi:lipoprotein-anchoring transpeptidase ErfK/SrfK
VQVDGGVIGKSYRTETSGIIGARRVVKYALIGALVLFSPAATFAAAKLSLDAVNRAEFAEGTSAEGPNAVTLRAQILLDRAHISPGAIDGRPGENTSRAIKAFQELNGFESSGKLDPPTWQALTADSAAVLAKYRIQDSDVKGPFLERLPESFDELAKLERVEHTSAAEALAERFHMHEELLRDLNSEVDFSEPGTSIVVAATRKAPDRKVTRVVVSKAREAVIAFGDKGDVVSYYPATVGSEQMPSPSGTVKVSSIALDATYHYRPDLGIKDGPDHPLKIAPGPNNPVGGIWIDLEKDGYGLHGTPDPAEIGKTASHGCVRMTNWDARELAKLAPTGTPVEFIQQARPLSRMTR